MQTALDVIRGRRVLSSSRRGVGPKLQRLQNAVSARKPPSPLHP
jgi:hypothetical protein